jgi:hypothetical protein
MRKTFSPIYQMLELYVFAWNVRVTCSLLGPKRAVVPTGMFRVAELTLTVLFRCKCSPVIWWTEAVLAATSCKGPRRNFIGF